MHTTRKPDILYVSRFATSGTWMRLLEAHGYSVTHEDSILDAAVRLTKYETELPLVVVEHKNMGPQEHADPADPLFFVRMCSARLNVPPRAILHAPFFNADLEHLALCLGFEEVAYAQGETLLSTLQRSAPEAGRAPGTGCLVNILGGGAAAKSELIFALGASAKYCNTTGETPYAVYFRRTDRQNRYEVTSADYHRLATRIQSSEELISLHNERKIVLYKSNNDHYIFDILTEGQQRATEILAKQGNHAEETHVPYLQQDTAYSSIEEIVRQKRKHALAACATPAAFMQILDAANANSLPTKNVLLVNTHKESQIRRFLLKYDELSEVSDEIINVYEQAQKLRGTRDERLQAYTRGAQSLQQRWPGLDIAPEGELSTPLRRVFSMPYIDEEFRKIPFIDCEIDTYRIFDARDRLVKALQDGGEYAHEVSA
jgi:hypothetical protein